jgi:hypothetical protein
MSFKEEVRNRVFKKLEIGLSETSARSLRAVKGDSELTLVAVPKACLEFNKDGTVTIPELLYQHMVAIIVKRDSK